MNSRYEVRIELIKLYPLKAYQLMSQKLTKTFGFNPKQIQFPQRHQKFYLVKFSVFLMDQRIYLLSLSLIQKITHWHSWTTWYLSSSSVNINQKKTEFEQIWKFRNLIPSSNNMSLSAVGKQNFCYLLHRPFIFCLF